MAPPVKVYFTSRFVDNLPRAAQEHQPVRDHALPNILVRPSCMEVEIGIGHCASTHDLFSWPTSHGTKKKALILPPTAPPTAYLTPALKTASPLRNPTFSSRSTPWREACVSCFLGTTSQGSQPSLLGLDRDKKNRVARSWISLRVPGGDHHSEEPQRSQQELLPSSWASRTAKRP